MALSNTETRWGAVSKWLHWLIALLIIVASLIMWHANDSTYWFKSNVRIFLEWVHWHKALGLIAFALILFRLWWRRRQPVPQTDDLTDFEERWSSRVHWAFYALMIALPITGWLSSSLFGSTVNVFGLFVIPPITPENKELVGPFYWAHFVMAWALTALVVFHIGAALYHHFVKRDRVLKSMLPEQE
ncbi:cytochrome b [Altererythrobacter sp. MF3-039]|uniref:cytochrome b n=1 Tax=Altererythrobacter sp. MF3-039 TaxID=3252901 RepID=UPI00390C559B